MSNFVKVGVNEHHTSQLTHAWHGRAGAVRGGASGHETGASEGHMPAGLPRPHAAVLGPERGRQVRMRFSRSQLRIHTENLLITRPEGLTECIELSSAMSLEFSYVGGRFQACTLSRPTFVEISARLQTLVQEHAAVVSVAAQAVTKVGNSICAGHCAHAAGRCCGFSSHVLRDVRWMCCMGSASQAIANTTASFSLKRLILLTRLGVVWFSECEGVGRRRQASRQAWPPAARALRSALVIVRRCELCPHRCKSR